MTVVGNLSRAGGVKATDHAVSSAGWLSGAVAKQTEAEDISVGITIDQVLAQQHRPGHAVPVARVRHRGFLGLRRRLRAGLQLHLHEHDLLGGETAPLPMEINPRVAFERMFGRAGTADAAAGAHARGPQHPRFDRRGGARAAAACGVAGSRAARRLPRQRARDRAPHPAHRGQQRRRRDRWRAPVGIPEHVRGAHRR